jgi:hypothetical protein
MIELSIANDFPMSLCIARTLETQPLHIGPSRPTSPARPGMGFISNCHWPVFHASVAVFSAAFEERAHEGSESVDLQDFVEFVQQESLTSCSLGKNIFSNDIPFDAKLLWRLRATSIYIPKISWDANANGAGDTVPSNC